MIPPPPIQVFHTKVVVEKPKNKGRNLPNPSPKRKGKKNKELNQENLIDLVAPKLIWTDGFKNPWLIFQILIK